MQNDIAVLKGSKIFYHGKETKVLGRLIPRAIKEPKRYARVYVRVSIRTIVKRLWVGNVSRLRPALRLIF